MSEVKHTPAREWAQANGYVANPTVRLNKNGYPFITLKKEGSPKGEGGLNLYFSKDSALQVAEGEILTAEQRGDMVITEYANEAGEDRMKLSFGGESQFVAF